MFVLIYNIHIHSQYFKNKCFYDVLSIKNENNFVLKYASK